METTAYPALIFPSKTNLLPSVCQISSGLVRGSSDNPSWGCQKLLHILKVRHLKLRVRAFKKIIWGGSKRRLLFLPGNLQWKLVNALHATTHLGEKALQRWLERFFRGTGLQTTIGQVVSSCPTWQLNKLPQGAQRPQLAQSIQQRGTYPGEDWQANGLHPDASFSRVYIPISHDRYIHRTDWRLSHLDWESWGGSKKLLHEIILRFGLPLQSDKERHHLLLRSPKGSLKHWALLISIVAGGLNLQEK